MVDGLNPADLKINTWITAASAGAAMWFVAGPGSYRREYPNAASVRTLLLNVCTRDALEDLNVYTLAEGRRLVVGSTDAVALYADELDLYRAWNALEPDDLAPGRIATVGIPVAAYGLAVAAEVFAFTGVLPYAVDSYVTAVSVAVKLHGEDALLATDPVLVGRVVATAGGPRLRDAMMAAMAIAG